MTYCTLTDLIEAYGETAVLQRADRDGDGVADPDVVRAASAAATAEIDGWISRRYAVPLADPPPRIRQAAVALAWFYLHGGALPDGDPVRLDYVNQLKWLQAVAAGGADVPGASPAAGSAAAASGAAFAGPRRLLSRDSLREF